ncbi:Zinc-dependent peptidase [Sulfidibacter corallicola]
MLVDAQTLKRNRLNSLKLSALIALPILLMAGYLHRDRTAAILLLVLAGVCALVGYRLFTAKVRRRWNILAQPVPEAYEPLLKQHVAYYNALEPDCQARFLRLVQVFLAETPISGIDLEVTDHHRILVAASAVIPVMGFPHWEYEYLSEVLLYPANFDKNYDVGSGEDQRILGMVHGSLNNGVVILSEPALVAGFANPHDKRNVGIHEFAHMVDKRDGSIDGVAAALPPDLIAPWRNLMEEKMREVCKGGKGAIDPYGKTNEQEFLAVTTEYFFESPQKLAKAHPKVYEMLSRIYNQDTAQIFAEEYHLLTRKRLGRNDPCPCHSGRKYKRCCLRRKH